MYVAAHHIISPLGVGTEENFENAQNGKSGIRLVDDNLLYPEPFYGAQIENFKLRKGFTKLESLFIQSIQSTLDQVDKLDKNRTILILSTTKGNIDLLGDSTPTTTYDRIHLHKMAAAVNDHFGMPHQPVVISNACISGVSAILIAQKLTRTGKYDHAIVSGGDLLTEFVVSGFQSLMAIDEKPCQPYDKDRAGINLGEACATMLLTKEHKGESLVKVLGGGQSNDANHISGPSRTGEGLKIAVEEAQKAANISLCEIDYINAHGTATVFNDEMESIAFDRLGVSDKPVNSLKGYFGHTLGAAGLIESIFAIKQMQKKLLLPSMGFRKMGVSKSLNIVAEPTPLDDKASVALKTVSGFGGCNAAIIFEVT